MTISLITPVWNNAETIGQCIDSINRQTEHCQHILVDGGSTDGTLEIIAQKKAADAILVSEPDRGMYDAINKGLQLAQGDIIGILNSDDFYPDEEILKSVVDVFQDPGVDASYGDLYYVDRNDTGKIIRNWKSGEYKPSRFYNGWMPPHPTFFIRKSWYEQYGGYRLDMGSAADYELMLRMLLKHGASAAYIPKVMVHMRNAGMSNASIKGRLMANRNDQRAWSINGIRPKPWTIAAKPLRKIGQWLN